MYQVKIKSTILEEKEINQIQVVLIIHGYWLSGLLPSKLSTPDQKTQRNTVSEEAEFKHRILNLLRKQSEQQSHSWYHLKVKYLGTK